MIVYVVTQIHKGVIWNISVFENCDDAADYKYELELLLSDDDLVDLQECEIITHKRELCLQ